MFFRFMASMRRVRRFGASDCDAGKCWHSPADFRAVWLGWKRVRRRPTGRATFMETQQRGCALLHVVSRGGTKTWRGMRYFAGVKPDTEKLGEYKPGSDKHMPLKVARNQAIAFASDAKKFRHQSAPDSFKDVAERWLTMKVDRRPHRWPVSVNGAVVGAVELHAGRFVAVEAQRCCAKELGAARVREHEAHGQLRFAAAERLGRLGMPQPVARQSRSGGRG